MLTQIEIERLPSFAIGFERGEVQGMEASMEQGLEEGKAQVVQHLLNRLGVAEVSELLDLAPAEVEHIAATGDDDNPEGRRH